MEASRADGAENYLRACRIRLGHYPTDDPTGMAFATLADEDSTTKALSVSGLAQKIGMARIEAFGWRVQSIGHSFPEERLNEPVPGPGR